ncbi:MAG: hypothetical protein VZR09_02295 [Candidatus Gastranaerophilaceae bacterium]|nr:hypothetical protein [Candidatus Gastranaerophilaceae bacterium]
MSKAYWNGVLNRLPDFCRNMGKTAMMGAMMAEYNSHRHHHFCCGPSIWGGFGPGMGDGYYWNNMAGMGGMYPMMGSCGGYQGGYMNQGMAQNLNYGNNQLISPDYIQARMNSIYNSQSTQNSSQNQATTQQSPQNQDTGVQDNNEGE